MHIAISAQLLSFARSYRSGGISRYIYHLLRALARQPSPHRLTAFVPDLPVERAEWETGRLGLHATRWPTERPAPRILWEQVAQPWLLSRERVDLLHATGYVSPLAWRGPTVVTIYDLSFIRFPHLFNAANRLYLRVFARISARRAWRILTISEHSRRDIIDLLGVPAERVATTYCGVDGEFQPLDAREVAAYRARRGLPERYLLYLGTLEPRKNIGTLLRAYAELRASGTTTHELVLAGAPGWQYESLFDTLRQYRLSEHVRLLGFVEPDEQALCYNAADLFVYPSLYEGFGLPVLEAMACGTPVVSSNAASLPEVVGDAGALVDPHDHRKLAEAMGHVLNDIHLRERFREAGLLRARGFTWEAMAQQTLGVYEQACSPIAEVAR
jgi:glycosyltransferase involved in cell wall biosynthesis